MSSDTLSSYRKTQRAPRSCRSCAARKVKCDKRLPCSTCIRQGTPETCSRELVMVRGEVTRGKDPVKLPTYDELVQENQRLRIALEASQVRPASDLSLRRPRTAQKLLECHDPLEEMVFKSPPFSQVSRHRQGWSTVDVPCRKSSELLIAYDKKWNSWVHYALEYPEFDREHTQFMDNLEKGAVLSDCDPGWLSVYFSVITAALLMMDDKEAREILPAGDLESMLQQWYKTALFCLEEADYMRSSTIRPVQAIAVLGMCFHNFGDSGLYRHLWSCAIRIARILGLDGTRSPHPPTELGLEAQRRLWWTLIICEWLAVPYYVPQVDEGDFNVPLPSAESDIDGPHPVLYHIFMARTSTVYHRFRSALREGTQSVSEVVRLADDELAEVINTLPDHLQPDSGKTEEMQELELIHPWIKWQRFDISLVLLHHRMRINRSLQKEWLAVPGLYDWARAVCIRSAMDIIWITHNWDQPVAMRRQWALSMHIFVAAIFLLRESHRAQAGAEVDFTDEVQLAIEYLDEVKSRNAIAERAVAILRSSLDETDTEAQNS
ncbi:C6 zinc finger domain containing protein [Colletotrichum scovillei]|uniref:C6 zinc finger domain containing protein n=2 Tax=Colletotrichum scovillei TaxID=1209932 RepID=A0A9P7QSS8_9PEZI|nr:C6 zinc finger domain containing protein [Colletotrichum scovillei]KAG7041882.1 C6 zinc finger domain containing protein [Colletotrichum scovillei]